MLLHPLFVHFPIALLTCYAVIEILPLARWYPRVSWDAIKIVLLVLGVGGGKLAVFTGLMAEESIAPSIHSVIELHEKFALTTLVIFSMLTLAYLVRWISHEHRDFWDRWLHVLDALRPMAEKMLHRPVAVSLALLGLISITVTGALGGAVAFGPEVDPIASFVYHLFF